MNMQALLKQAQKMQKDINKVEKELNEKTYEASVGGGAIKVVLKGTMEIVDLQISDEVEITDVADMLKAAINTANKAAHEDRENTMNAITGGIKMPF